MKRHEKEFGQYFEDWKNHREPWSFWEYQRLEQVFISPSMCDTSSGQWSNWHQMQRKHIIFLGDPDYNFRRKQETIFPRGIDLPKPITEEPRQGKYCWAFTPEIPQGYMNISYNRFGDMCHWSLFQNRCLHESEENVLKLVAWWKSEVIDKCK